MHPDAQRAWQYINIILTNSQLFVPVMDLVRALHVDEPPAVPGCRIVWPS